MRKFVLWSVMIGLAILVAACGSRVVDPPPANADTSLTLTAIFSSGGTQLASTLAAAEAATATQLSIATPTPEAPTATVENTPSGSDREDETAQSEESSATGEADETQAAASQEPTTAATRDNAGVQPTYVSYAENDGQIRLNFNRSQAGDGVIKRPGPSVQALYLAEPPEIDANLSDFFTPKYALDYVVLGETLYAGETDLSGYMQIGWDEEYLYIAVRVKDAKFVQLSSGPQLYRGDSLEILLDWNVTGDYDNSTINEDDIQLGISPGNLDASLSPTPDDAEDGEDVEPIEAEAYLWTPANLEGTVAAAEIAARLTDDGYVMEVAIPWTALGIAPYADQHLGFLFSVSDNDDVTRDVQQTMISFAPERILHDPTTWYDLWLVNPEE